MYVIDFENNKHQRIYSLKSLFSFKILHWKKGAILYEYDNIVNYSVAQRLKTMLSKEKVDINRVANITIERKKDDLIFKAELV
jgi:hypothetical protein